MVRPDGPHLDGLLLGLTGAIYHAGGAECGNVRWKLSYGDTANVIQ